MISLVFFLIGIVITLLVGLWKAHGQCIRLSLTKEAWKDFACALEAAFESELESHDAWRYQRHDDWKVASRQHDNACNYTELSLIRLCQLGEYEDAHESSPFMPRGGTLAESIELLKHQRAGYPDEHGAN